MGLGISAKWGCEMSMTKRQAQMIISLEVDVCISDFERKLPKHPFGFQKSCHLQEHQNDTSNEWCKADTFEYRSWKHETQSCFISWELRVGVILLKEHVQEFHLSAHWDLLSFIFQKIVPTKLPPKGGILLWKPANLGGVFRVLKNCSHFHLLPTNLSILGGQSPIQTFGGSAPDVVSPCLSGDFGGQKLPWLTGASKTSISGVLLLLALTCTFYLQSPPLPSEKENKKKQCRICFASSIPFHP